MISIYRCCGFESNSFERPFLEERIVIEKQSKEEKEKPTFYSGDTVSVYNDDIYHHATIIYVEKVMSFLEGECQHMYARFHNPVAYHDFLKKGSRLISIHPKGVHEKCVVVTILYEEDAGEKEKEKEKIKEILVKNESTMSPRMVYSINLEKIDSILINEYKIKQV